MRPERLARRVFSNRDDIREWNAGCGCRDRCMCIKKEDKAKLQRRKRARSVPRTGTAKKEARHCVGPSHMGTECASTALTIFSDQ